MLWFGSESFLLIYYLHMQSKISKTIILAIVLCGCETLSLTLRKNIVSLFEGMALRRMLGPKSDKVIGAWRKLHNEELRISLHHALLGQLNQKQNVAHAWERSEICAGSYLENLMEDIFWQTWNGFIWFTVKSNGGCFWPH